MKQRVISEAVVLRLLHGSRVEVRPHKEAKALIICDDTQPKAKVINVENDTQEMAPNLTVTFANLKFSDGSEQKKMKLQFEMQIAGKNSEVVTVQSDFSEPLIVLTHQTQWEVSEGTLFKHDAFKGKDNQPLKEIPWPQFANALGRHFLRVTQGSRPLSKDDFRYLHSLLDNSHVISIDHLDKFWKRFGKVLYKIRHQKICLSG